jgi:hypothetical protein
MYCICVPAPGQLKISYVSTASSFKYSKNTSFLMCTLLFFAVLRNCMFMPDTGAEFFHPGSQIQGQKDSGSLILIRIKEFLSPKIVSKSRKYDPDCSSRIRILIFTHTGSGIQRSKDNGCRIRNTGL